VFDPRSGSNHEAGLKVIDALYDAPQRRMGISVAG